MEKVKLTDICDFQGGSQPPKEEWSFDEQEGYIRMLQIRDFTQGERVTPEYIKISNTTKMCEANDILIARYGASIGKILTGLAGAYNVAIMRTIPDTSRIKKLYLYYYLKSPYFQNAILNVGSRAAQAGFNKEDLSKLDIECPELIKQDKIIAVLEKLECIIEKRKIELSNLDDLIKARFVEMFGDPATNPMRWSETTIGDECFYIKDGPHKSLPDIGKENGGHPFISVRNIVNGYIDFSTARYISDEDYANAIKKCHPEKGDMLYSKGGTTGIAKLIDIDEEFANWVHVAVLKFDKSKLNGIFFENMLNGDYCFEQSQRLTKGIANRDLVLSAMAQIKMYRPPMEIQKQFADFVNQVDKSKLYKISTLQFPCIPG